MNKIFKYNLTVEGDFTLVMPKDAQILTIQLQGGDPVLWAIVNPKKEAIVRKFRTIGTGHDITNLESLSYIGTYQQYEGQLICHLFEID